MATLLVALSFSGKAQNIQLHYDFGHLVTSDKAERPVLTSTVEMFRPDTWGSTFFFVDMDYQNSGVKAAYWEIVRELRFWEMPLSLHLEYNGGLNDASSYDNAYLLGSTYSFNAKDFSYGFGITPMYKYKYLAKQKHPHHSFQLTGTWYYHCANGLLTFSGFADFWGDRTFLGENMMVFLAEPQLWFNLNKLNGMPKDFNLSIGGEVEMSYNFPILNKKFYAIPTLGLKWSF